LEDNTIFSKKSTMRTIGGAVVGGVFGGEAGAIVGGLSGGSSEHKKVSSVQVAILLRDIHNPRIVIDCFNSPVMTGSKETKVSSSTGDLYYKQGLEQANQIKDIISVIINMALTV
jgi:hypothetical protein